MNGQGIGNRIDNDEKKIINRAIVRAVKLLNVVLVGLPFIVVWYLYYSSRVDVPFYRRGNYLIVFLFYVIYYLLAHLYNGYLIHLSRISEVIYAQTLAILFDNFILYIVTWLLAKHLPHIWPLLLSLVIEVGIIVLWAYLAHKWYFKKFPPLRTVIVWQDKERFETLVSRYGTDKHFHILSTPTVQECLDADMAPLADAEAVFLSDVHSHDRNRLLKYCIEHDIKIYVIPGVGDALMSGAQQLNLFHLPILQVERYNPTPEFLAIKRIIDILLSLIAVIITSPIMLIVAIAIRALDGGPAFYRQERLTKNGRIFRLIKFRSMRIDAEKDGIARLSSGEDDERITSVGRVIRKYRIDELPQLFNIIKGDMSIVGPRPERPEIAAEYEQKYPEFTLRLQAKAGLTGYAQVYGKYNSTPYTKLLMDLYYIAHPSFAQDMRLILATVKILFLPDSTEGVAKGKTTAAEEESEEV